MIGVIDEKYCFKVRSIHPLTKKKAKKECEMEANIDLHEMDAMARRIQLAAERLNRLGKKFPTLTKNSLNVLTSAKMLELNINDLINRKN
jgi:hypothetical protein